MIRYALITHDFRVPCAAEEGLFCGRLGGLETLDTVMSLGQKGDKWSFLSAPPYTLWYDFLSGRPNRAVSAGLMTIETTNESGLVRLKEKGGYLSVSAQGAVDVVEGDPERFGDRSMFRLIPWEAFTKLWAVVRQTWSLGPDGEKATVDEWKSSFRSLKFGSLRVDFDQLCEAIMKQPAPHELLFMAERNVYRAALYRPGVLYVVFGDKVLQEFRTSLESLMNPGFYTGEILVATNLLSEQIKSVVPPSMRDQCRIITMSAFDYPDYISTRQTLFSSGVLDDYAPLLYMDGDIAVNSPIEPNLLRGALERMSSAQLENFNGDFRHSQSNGAVLYSKDPYNLGRTEAGFNTGVFLVPNVKAQRHLLDPAFLTNLIYTDMHGRGSIPFHEQSVMNYALRKIDAFDATLINSVTDVGGDPNSPIVKEYGSMAPERARGFVHFWCYGGANRSLPMGNYTRQIRHYRRRKGL
ncbi:MULTISPECIES: hypothetical protein [unclassified Saccharibacter]|uniref:hypothetical protein n=1 Tax=unclassified Saccharibacter TaxID=2648722 RepID=UPI0013213BA9|nr:MULTISPECIES: hypothetical protein [unclassified Saccharibacter]MXV35517.1 hypothetical protein [Saccharibacter sp. EH611]MXV58177.1 hypothetical protein [Saccharibacter sp. EH70]MXV65451.1 hypothetical protein [Saccharibacter sp. EH60]